MKIYPLIILALIFLGQSCKDKRKGFQPSLDLEEYVLITTNGVERLFTVDNSINVSHEYLGQEDTPSVYINLNPEPNSFTHFIFGINFPEIGNMNDNVTWFNYLDYSLDDSFPIISVNCRDEECHPNMEITIHEYSEEIGSRYVGEFSGSFPEENGNPVMDFQGEFVVLVDD